MSLTVALTALTKVFTFIFIVSSMLGMGMSLTMRQILQPLGNLRLIALALAANFIVAPLLAFGVTRLVTLLIPLEPSLQITLIIISAAAGAPFLPKLVQWAAGNIALGVGLMGLLMVVTIAYMPLVLPLLLPGATVRPWDIGSSLFTVMLIPLALGLLTRSRLPDVAARWRGPMNMISNASILVLLVINFVLNYDNIVRLIVTGEIVALVLFILACLAAGYVIGGRDPRDRSVTALGTAQRNLSAALVVAVTNFPETNVFSLVLVTAVLELLLLLPIAKWLARRGKRRPVMANV